MRYLVISHKDVSQRAKVMVFLTEDQRRVYFETILYKSRLSDIAEYLLLRLDKFDKFEEENEGKEDDQKHEYKAAMKLKQTAESQSKVDYEKCLEDAQFYDSHTNIMYSLVDLS